MKISFYTSKNHICNRNSQEVPGLTFSGQGRCKININFRSLPIYQRQRYKQKPGKQSHSHSSKIIRWISLTKVKALHKETLKHQGRCWRRHKMSSPPMHAWFGDSPASRRMKLDPYGSVGTSIEGNGHFTKRNLQIHCSPNAIPHRKKTNHLKIHSGTQMTPESQSYSEQCGYRYCHTWCQVRLQSHNNKQHGTGTKTDP